MKEDIVDFITYTNKHSSIIENGVEAINEALNGIDIAEKRSLLFCLDKIIQL